MPKKIAVIALLVIAIVAVAGAATYIVQQKKEAQQRQEGAEKVRQEEQVATTTGKPMTQSPETLPISGLKHGLEPTKPEATKFTGPSPAALVTPESKPYRCDPSKVYVEIPKDNPTIIYLITDLQKRQIFSIKDIPEKRGVYLGFRTASLSPDCKKIAISVQGGDELSDWRGILDLDNNTTKALLDIWSGIERFTWSPDGRYLAAEDGSETGVPLISVYDFKRDKGYNFGPPADLAYYYAHWTDHNKLRYCTMLLDQYIEERQRGGTFSCGNLWEFDPLTETRKLLR